VKDAPVANLLFCRRAGGSRCNQKSRAGQDFGLRDAPPQRVLVLQRLDTSPDGLPSASNAKPNLVAITTP